MLEVDQARRVDGTNGDAGGRRPVLIGAALVGLLAVPLLVALAVLHTPRWYPLLDLAQAEMRVRDVWSRHPPLLGAAGRIEAFGARGSHPGPLTWYVLAPIHGLFGRSAWGLQVASATSHVAAITVALWLGQRRGGTPLLLTVGAALAVLAHVHGPAQLTEAWNPYLPVLWWFVLLLATWSVLCGDLAALPVAVFAGSYCAQAHVSYLGLVGGLAALLVAAGAAWAVRHRADRAGLGRLARWTAGSAALGLLLWAPPLVEQVTNDPGNMTIVIEHLGNPVEEPLGAARGLELLAVHLNPWRLLAGQQGTGGAVAPALGLVAVWLVAVVVSRRLGDRALLRLHGLVAVALALAVASTSRIFGEAWFYLVLWAWGLTTLVLVAIAWTAVAALVARRAGRPRGSPADGTSGPATDTVGPASDVTLGRGLAVTTARLPVALAAVPVAIAVVWTALFTVDATGVEVPSARQSELVAQLTPPTIAALQAADPAGTGEARDGRYLITWTDPVALGSAPQGLMLELERRGFDVRVLPVEVQEVAMRSHRVARPEEVTAELHVAIGPDIAHWRQRAEATELAAVDVRDDAERARYGQLRSQLVTRLTELGRADAAQNAEERLSLLAFEPDLPDDLRAVIREMSDIGQPAAVFLLPDPA